MKCDTAIEEMSLVPGVLRGSLLARSLDVGRLIAGLTDLIEELHGKHEESLRPSIVPDIDTVWARFASCEYDLTRMDKRDQRALCVSPKTAMQAQLVEAAIRHVGAFQRFSTLYGFVTSYFACWRLAPNPDQAEALIKHLIVSQSKTRRNRVLATWAENQFLFSADADTRLASTVVRSKKTPAEICESLYIDLTTSLASRAAEAALRLAVDAVIERPPVTSETGTLGDLRWLLDNLMPPAMLAEPFREALGRLVLSEIPIRYPEAKAQLVAKCIRDERLGDPRYPAPAARWRSMQAHARDRLLSWLAADAIDLFFNTLLPPRDENRRRAEFWLGYAKKPGNIQDFQAVICSEDEPMLRQVRSTIPAYSRMEGASTSAFMMQFEGYGGRQYIVIEFSETGNAAHVYPKQAFEKTGLSLRSRAFELGSLKRRSEVNARIIHNGEWERKAWVTLYELGIRQ